MSTKKKEAAIELLNEYLKSSHFQQKYKKISFEIKSLSSKVESEFMMQITKIATDVATSSSSSNHGGKHNYKQRGIPKLSIQQQRSNSKSYSMLNNDDGDDVTEMMALSYSGLNFRISIPHFKKLQILFDRNHKKSTTVQEHKDSFHKALFTALCRYEMLEGGGLQSALGGNVFDVLLKRLHCNKYGVICFTILLSI